METLLYKKMTEDEMLLEEIRNTGRQLDVAKTKFEFECDEDMVDSIIYEIQSLNARYRYLLRIAKERNIQSTDIGALYVRSA